MVQRSIDADDRESFLRLCRAIWSWDICDKAHQTDGCVGHQCVNSADYNRLELYWRYCKQVISPETPFPRNDPSSLHPLQDELLKLIQMLRKDPSTTRQCLREAANTPRVSLEPRNFQKETIDAAVKLLIMSDCSTFDRWSINIEAGMLRQSWRDNVGFSKFVESILPPKKTHTVLSFPGNLEYTDCISTIKATKLVKHLGISIRPTDDIQNHLSLDSKNRQLYIFHYTGFLKEHLRLTKNLPRDLSIDDFLRLGTLPRQYILEILDSLQSVLFPVADKKSRKLLRSLVTNLDLDEDILSYHFVSIRNVEEEGVAYYYLADRLAALRSELENPRPQGWFERLLERKSSARFVMMATLIGIIFAVILGMASLAVSSYQTWLAYQAWKHPVSAGSD